MKEANRRATTKEEENVPLLPRNQDTTSQSTVQAYINFTSKIMCLNLGLRTVICGYVGMSGDFLTVTWKLVSEQK